MAKVLERLLGSEVNLGQGDELRKVPVVSLAGPRHVIGLYFCAGWCCPCKAFTPKLVDFYNGRRKSGNTFEIIFISWDKDETGYNENYSTMPWLAVPFDPDTKTKNKLSKKYHVQGIPKLILIDGQTGRTITREGYAHIMEDPQGAQFPWKHKTFKEIIPGPLINNKSEKIDAAEALNGKFVGLYFSAHWCPPCRAFTPELVKLYESLHARGRNVEVVFVTSDRSEESFEKYLESMPWLAIPYGDPRLEKLKQTYKVDGIPTLVVLDEKGDVATLNGRMAMNLDKTGEEFPWYPKPLNMLTEEAAVALNEAPCLVLFTECNDLCVDEAKKALSEIAADECQKGEDQELYFFYAPDSDFCDSVRDFADLDDQVPLLVILDFPERRLFVSKETLITKDVAKAFVNSYFNGSLVPQSVR